MDDVKKYGAAGRCSRRAMQAASIPRFCKGLKTSEHHAEMYWRYWMLEPSKECGTIMLVILEAPAVAEKRRDARTWGPYELRPVLAQE